MECQKCGGTGFLYEESLLDGGRYCECKLLTLKIYNMDLVWRSLSRSTAAPGKPKLTKYISQNLWISSPMELFRSHLKALCYLMPSSWDARVRSDADILDSWFGTAKAQGVKIFDLEVSDSKVKAIDIADLIGPPSLVILVLGVKRLPNKETPNAVLEAISYRQHDDVPTWIVDQPENPILSTNHNAYSESLEEILQGWQHINLSDRAKVVPRVVHTTTQKATQMTTQDVPLSEEKAKSILSSLNTAETPKYKQKGGRRK